ncbi:LamB/YcsF family protein [Metabacillus herbersteinensis]|uniref:5-oxoprolinase subunit A n=1 Tax=Metabacillus herbersteinensis TaxID=283816 RepID=A0ABV6GGC1_9BACI
MMIIDLNCDMGESFGAYQIGKDDELLKHITSANIACGFHAGDPSIMRKTVKLALEHNVGIGAHPGFQDIVGFGRRTIDLTAQEVYNIVVYQIGALNAFVESEGGKMQHIKAHGALYNIASRNIQIAEAIAEAVYKVNPEWILFGLAGSELIKAGERIGLQTAQEVFADRTYQKNGALTPRTEHNALITDPDLACQQVIEILQEGKVTCIQGDKVLIKADTICVHGDGENAVQFVTAIRSKLQAANVVVRRIGER